MVDRIQLLRNIGQFENVSPGQQTGLTKLTLIYAENGRGKTTLASILRSLGTNSPTPIIERHRLGAPHSPHVVIDVNGRSHTFQNGAWSAPLSDIAIFDDNFVAQNVCSGIEIETGHKQNLHELILGAQGVALNATLKTHVDEVEVHNRALKTKEAAIPAAERGTLTVDAFCALPVNVNIEAEVKAAERNLAAARAADAIKQQPSFQALELPAFDAAAINAVLQSDLPGLQADTTALVKRHLAKLGKGAEAWVGEGMQKIPAASAGETGEECPFCAQGLEHARIIPHYQAYFSEGYAALKQAITDHGKAVATAHDGEVQSAFERAVRLAIQTGDFWRKFTEVPVITVDTAEIARAWKASREPVLAILRAKLASPLEKMALTQEIVDDIAAYDAHRDVIAAISRTLSDSNAQISAVKEKAATANVVTLNAELTKLKMTLARHSPTIAPLCQAYLDEKSAKKATELLRDKARAALDQYRASIFTRYEAAINTYLGRFNAGFRLAGVSSQNHRGGSSCTYSVLINNVTVPLIADDGPSFKNSMSAGDRNTLALAFYFASLDQDLALAQKIVVIDDPMTSLDEHRSLATVQEMRTLAKRVKQVIVLSHSKPFLCQIWEGSDKDTRSALRIIRSGQSASSIDAWDVHQDCITEHDKRHAMIQHYITMGHSGKEREVAAALRHVLEAFLRVAYPAHFPPGKLLGHFHNECDQALTTSATILNQVDTVELRHLMDYANRFHHDTNPAYATATINDQELVDHATRTMKFARRA
ncbi:MAG: AAA family ATPase [Flavobacteriales bacterium]|nr:MAG: AAA family ATPase [Flavobacteriales bacterium]